MYFPTTRVLTILELLQSRQQLSGPELAQRLEVNARTVRRYITMLQDLGFPAAAPAVEGALAKIERVLPLALREQVQAVQETLILDLTHSGPTPRTNLVVTLCAAAQQCRRVWLHYSSWQSETTERAVDLYGIVYRSGFWYAVGYCHLRAGLRVFRLDRILQ